MHVGLLIVATGRYAGFLPELLSDCSERFLPGRERTAFVFSARPPPPAAGLHVAHVPTRHEPWLLPTLSEGGRDVASAHGDATVHGGRK
jgi:hypothetical protein